MGATGRKIGALVVGVLIGVVGITIASSLANDPAPEAEPRKSKSDAASGNQLVGREYAESLGLPVILDPNAPGCRYSAEEPVNETLFCMDSVAGSPIEAQLIGIRIGGRVPTQLDRELAVLTEEFNGLEDTDANQERRIALMDRMAELTVQIQAAAG
jgi:hypothetical protein